MRNECATQRWGKWEDVRVECQITNRNPICVVCSLCSPQWVTIQNYNFFFFNVGKPVPLKYKHQIENRTLASWWCVRRTVYQFIIVASACDGPVWWIMMYGPCKENDYTFHNWWMMITMFVRTPFARAFHVSLHHIFFMNFWPLSFLLSWSLLTIKMRRAHTTTPGGPSGCVLVGTCVLHIFDFRR